MSLALYPSRVRSSELLGLIGDWIIQVADARKLAVDWIVLTRHYDVTPIDFEPVGFGAKPGK